MTCQTYRLNVALGLWATVIFYLSSFNSPPVRADIIYLKTGSSVEGKIISQDKKQVQVQTKSVTITLKTSEILEIVKEDYAPPVEVEPETEPDRSVGDAPKISPTSPAISPTLPISPTIAAKPSPISKTATPLVLSDEGKTADQKEINRLLRKIANLKEGEEYAPLADALVAKGKDNADYLMELLAGVQHPVALKWIIYTIGRLQLPDAIQPFYDMLTENKVDDSLKTVLLEAIDQMEGVSTIDLLRGLLTDETSATATKITVINLLAKKADVVSLPILVDFLDSENDDLRLAGLTAITAIVRTADKTKLEEIGLVDILKTKLPESTPRLRKAIINLLGQQNDPATIEILTGFLHDENAEIRADATMALGSFGDKKSMDLLLERLTVEEDRWTKIQLIGALQKTKEKSVIPVFIELLKDPEPDIQSSAARALGELTNNYYGENYEKWSEWWEAQKSKTQPK